MATAAAFKEIEGRLAANPAIVSKIKAVFEWHITGGGVYTMDLKGKGSIKEGKFNGKPDCVVTVAEQDFVDMLKGKTTSQKLFMKGKLKVKGGMQHAMKLGELMKSQPSAKL
uniref:SCP2 domain-containing protein n=1 Tax=Hemiselmis andersenii TaxID=464988 RepID=A0A6U4KF50_HEMAN|mmetsp:Transcript_38996/g.91012  ORF Transcript_38996/g.91012 Transcript_38996/m.91012 type:complete len:112 (+) Transcript_38996:27-362(+)